MVVQRYLSLDLRLSRKVWTSIEFLKNRIIGQKYTYSPWKNGHKYVFLPWKSGQKMIKRKIDNKIESFYKNHNKALLLTGARQTGKTFAIRRFGAENFDSTVEINFVESRNAIGFLDGAVDAKEMILRISALAKTKMIPGKTLIFFDEVQEYPEIVTLIKFLVEEGSYRYALSGSLLGVELKDLRSEPVGYMDIFDMYPLDFEEFLWANGITEQVIAFLRQCLQNGTPVPEALHQRMRELLLQYTVVGGMPDAVQTFVNTKRMDEVLQIQRDIVRSYEDDMVKYADRKDKAVIRECFQSIPKQLSKENKKFQYSVVKKGATASRFAGSLQWIEDAGIITRCYNLSITELPLDGNADQDVFKVYMKDTGLFVSMLEDGTQFDILQGNLLGYKGAIFEGLVADIFSKMGRKLYYFHKDSGLEVDFIIRFHGECTLVEVKAVSGNTKSSKTILRHPEKYHVYHLIKLGDYNVGREEQILTLPLYMAFLLTDV